MTISTFTAPGGSALAFDDSADTGPDERWNVTSAHSGVGMHVAREYDSELQRNFYSVRLDKDTLTLPGTDDRGAVYHSRMVSLAVADAEYLNATLMKIEHRGAAMSDNGLEGEAQGGTDVPRVVSVPRGVKRDKPTIYKAPSGRAALLLTPDKDAAASHRWEIEHNYDTGFYVRNTYDPTTGRNYYHAAVSILRSDVENPSPGRIADVYRALSDANHFNDVISRVDHVFFSDPAEVETQSPRSGSQADTSTLPAPAPSEDWTREVAWEFPSGHAACRFGSMIRLHTYNNLGDNAVYFPNTEVAMQAAESIRAAVLYAEGKYRPTLPEQGTDEQWDPESVPEISRRDVKQRDGILGTSEHKPCTCSWEEHEAMFGGAEWEREGSKPATWEVGGLTVKGTFETWYEDSGFPALMVTDSSGKTLREPGMHDIYGFIEELHAAYSYARDDVGKPTTPHLHGEEDVNDAGTEARWYVATGRRTDNGPVLVITIEGSQTELHGEDALKFIACCHDASQYLSLGASRDGD